MLHVKYENCRSSSFIEDVKVLIDDARLTHWYGNSSLWPFRPGELKIVGGVKVLVPAHRLMKVYICTKFHENILNDIRVMERTGKLTDRQTDGWTEGMTYLDPLTGI